MNTQDKPAAAHTPAPTGGAAFPWDEYDTSGNPSHQHRGMTLRDYFAAKAMLALASDFCIVADRPSDAAAIGRLSAGAYEIADAMLKARQT